MKTRATIISLACLLMSGAFTGKAQTLTCTFDFAGSGQLGSQSFSNAAIRITTVGQISAITVSPGQYDPGLHEILSHE
jgi:hypothetical protein